MRRRVGVEVRRGMRQNATDDMVRGTVVEEASLLPMDDDKEREKEIYRMRRRKRTEGAETPKTVWVINYRSALVQLVMRVTDDVS
jgi:hypothetical protein